MSLNQPIELEDSQEKILEMDTNPPLADLNVARFVMKTRDVTQKITNEIISDFSVIMKLLCQNWRPTNCCLWLPQFHVIIKLYDI